MKVFVGTSGWYYSWNPKLSFDWYAKNSGLNSIELNASFYRFPFSNMVKSWARKTLDLNPKLRWAIKVNRLVTHVFKFSEKAFQTWKKFKNLFKPLEESIDFYLFQTPPSFSPNSAKNLEKFIKKVNLKEKFALEIRNIKWFEEKWINWAKKLKITWVSVDAPDFTKFPRKIFLSNELVYLRMHGRTSWYSHNYSSEELREIAKNIEKIKPKKAYIYFNNNHNMLSNARNMLKILRK